MIFSHRRSFSEYHIFLLIVPVMDDRFSHLAQMQFIIAINYLVLLLRILL